MEYKIIKDEISFLAEKESWTMLYQTNSACGEVTPFQSWEWCYTWWKLREERDTLFVIKAFTGKKVEGYSPLIVKDKMVEFIGGRDLDYGRFLININSDCIKVINFFVDVIVNEGYGFRLQEMSANNMQIHAVQKILEKHKYYYVKKTTRTSFIPISKYKVFEDYLSTLSGKFRKSLRKINESNLVFKKAEISDETLAILANIFASRQEHRGGSKDFSWALPIIKTLGKLEMIEVFFAYLNDTPVAYHVVFCDLRAKYIWLIAHDSVAEKYSPGRFLRFNILKMCFDQRMQEMNNMRGDYDYKLEWNVELNTNYTIYVFRSFNRYIKFKLWFWLRPKIKRVVYSNSLLKRMYKRYA